MYRVLKLLQELPEIKKSFHTVHMSGFPAGNIIYDTDAFVSWKESIKYELLKLEQNPFVVDFLETLEKFNGWRDEKAFRDIEAKAMVIQKNPKDFLSLKDENSWLSLVMEILLELEKDGYIYLEPDDTRISFINNYIRLLKVLNAQGYFSSFQTDVIGGYEIELSDKAFMNGNTVIPQATRSSIPTIFISYNWKSSDFVDEIENAINLKCDVKRDKNSIGDWGSITDFMKTIRKEDFAILVVSDAYLKSTACLHEVIELMKDDKWDEKTMYVIMDDARDVYDGIKRVDYIKYWNDYCNKLNNTIAELPPSATYKQSEELKQAEMIRNSVGEFLVKVSDCNNPNAGNAISKIIERIDN